MCGGTVPPCAPLSELPHAAWFRQVPAGGSWVKSTSGPVDNGLRADAKAKAPTKWHHIGPDRLGPNPVPEWPGLVAVCAV